MSVPESGNAPEQFERPYVGVIHGPACKPHSRIELDQVAGEDC